MKADIKNLVLFFPWSKEDISIFRKKAPSSFEVDSVIRSVSFTRKVLNSMEFENSSVKGEVVLSDYLTEEMIEKLDTASMVKLNHESSMPTWDFKTRGWIIDLKNLHYFPVTNHCLGIFKHNIKVIKKFEDLEKFVEDFRFRFAAKKFGI